MSDMISRQAAIDALHTWFRDGFEEDKWWNSTHVLAALESVPSAPTERKNGKWIIKEYWRGEHIRKCSICNITQTVTTYKGKVDFNFCPYCGADMRGEQE